MVSARAVLAILALDIVAATARDAYLPALAKAKVLALLPSIPARARAGKPTLLP